MLLARLIKPKLMSRPLLLLIGLTALCQATSAQNSTPDSSIAAAYKNAVDTYYKFTDKQSRLYNGWLHIGYSHRIEGVAYYEDALWKSGTVVYDGLEFNDVNMMYDLYKDELIIQHFQKLMLTLHSFRVKSFSFNGHHFIRHVQDSTVKGSPATGFYEVLHEGKTRMMAKRVKILEETVTDVVQQRFTQKNFYYINSNNTWHNIKTFKDLRKSTLNEKSSEIRQYLRRNQIKFRKEKERALIEALQQFDAITQ
jgi:hypothetical protein